LKTAIALDPKFVLAYSALGAVYFKQKNYAGAVAQFQAALERDPFFADVYFHLGLVFYEQKEYASAVANLKTATELEPKNPNYYFHLGNALAKQKNHADAVASYRSAIALDAKYTEAYNNLGQVYYEQKKYALAMDNFKTAIALDPKFAGGYHNLGLVLYDQQNYKGAMDNFKTAIALDPKYANAYFYLGNCLERQKDYAGAIANLKTAIALDPKNAAACNNLASLLYLQKDYAGAAANFQKGIALAPKVPNPYVGLGMALVKQGQFSAAKEATQKVLSLLPPGQPLAQLALQISQECERRLAIAAKEKGEPLDPAAAKAGITGTLAAGDLLDAFSLTKHSFRKGHLLLLKSGTSYQIDLRGDFDTIVRVEDNQQQPLLSNNHMCPPQGVNSRLVFTPDKDGVYRLIVNSSKPMAAGNYTLKVQPVVKVGAAKLFSGALAKGDPVAQWKFVHKHKVTLTAGTPYVIELESQKFDTYLILLDTDGQRVLAENDDIVPEDTTKSRLDFTPGASGEYVLAVTSADPGETGPYTLKVQGYGPKGPTKAK
jgi:tetratricopeptide (TPR) repeat protein